jgi:hypothetical protein
MARYFLAHHTDNGHGFVMDYWRRPDGRGGDIRVWPVYHRDIQDPCYGQTTYTAQDRDLHVWEMSGEDYARAHQEGIEHTDIDDLAGA